jgi:FMN phosphatase YigB (HAD superfamily)
MPRFVKVLNRRGRRRDHLIPLLERTRAKGVRQAVVSDFGLIPERLEALGIPVHLFDDIVGAEDLGVMKPSAIPYRYLADKWHLPMCEILLVGDRRDQDEMSARLAQSAFIGIADNTPDDVFLAWPDVIRTIEACTISS